MLVLDWRVQAALPDRLCWKQYVRVWALARPAPCLYASTGAVCPGVGLPCLC